MINRNPAVPGAKLYGIYLCTVLFCLLPAFWAQSDTAPTAAPVAINSIDYNQIETMAQVTIISDLPMGQAGFNWYKIETARGYKLNIDILNATLYAGLAENIIKPGDNWIQEIRCQEKEEKTVRITIDIVKPLEFRIFRETKKILFGYIFYLYNLCFIIWPE